MRWLRIGEKVHVVSRARKYGRTLCGLEVTRARRIEHDGNFDERCGACDARWRDIGRANKPAASKVDRRVVYKPRYTFADYEDDPRWENPSAMLDDEPSGGPI